MEEKETLFKNLIEFILGKKFWFLSFGIFLLIFSAVGLTGTRMYLSFFVREGGFASPSEQKNVSPKGAGSLRDRMFEQATKEIQVNSNFDQWFSADDPLMKAKKNFEKTFGNSDTEAILFRSDNVFSYESLELIQELTQELETKVPQLDKVISLTSFEFSYADGDTVYIGDLIPEEIPHDMNELQKIKEKALQKENIINQLFSDNMQETWILIRLRNFDEAFQKEHEVEGGLFYIGKQIDQIIHQPKYKKYSLHTAGVIALAHDQTTFFEKEASALLGTAFLMALLLLIVFTRSFVGTLVPLFTVISSIVVTYGMMGHLQIPVEANMMTYPIFIGLAVSIGYAIHLHNAFSRYFRETKKRQKSVVFAWQNHIWALTFTAVTTVAALLTLNSASIVSIRWVGNASASVVTVSFFFVIIFLPIFLSTWTSPQKKKNKEPQAKNSQPSNKQTTKRIFFRSRSTVNYIPFAEKFFTNLAYFVIKKF